MYRGGRGGSTLVEVVVSVAILGLLASMAGLALGGPPAPPDPLEAARRAALRSGAPAYAADSSEVRLFLPDGRSLGPGLDPMTGRPIVEEGGP